MKERKEHVPAQKAMLLEFATTLIS